VRDAGMVGASEWICHGGVILFVGLLLIIIARR
jgi:hypothetical protein